jgi:hypothetical protein
MISDWLFYTYRYSSYTQEYTYTCIHTYVRTYIHTYIHCIHTYIACIHTYVHIFELEILKATKVNFTFLPVCIGIISNCVLLSLPTVQETVTYFRNCDEEKYFVLI